MEIEGKSRTLSFFLTLLLGPLGLFYTSAKWGIILSVIAIATIQSILGPIICWILAIAIGDYLIEKYNSNLRRFNMMLNMSERR